MTTQDGYHRRTTYAILFGLCTLLAVFPAARAQISTPLWTINHQPAQCDTTSVILSHGEPPYNLTISYPNNTNPTQTVTERFTNRSASTIVWPANVCGGTEVTITVVDSEGQTYDGAFLVYLGKNTSCLTDAQLESDICLDPPREAEFKPNDPNGAVGRYLPVGAVFAAVVAAVVGVVA
ncbi:hypothetical protein C8Q76DRAFT_857577 [Earliella scabrosa]|nr:hypothetical protein C8Q76DRAFT_857577 [Earliella scabrosa]